MIVSGENGLLVPARSPAAIAAAIEKLLRDPEAAAQMARRARERVQAHAWPQIKQGWAQVYAGVTA
jgi:glycosyltransferase involved in cell wall biosynthesis